VAPLGNVCGRRLRTAKVCIGLQDHKKSGVNTPKIEEMRRLSRSRWLRKSAKTGRRWQQKRLATGLRHPIDTCIPAKHAQTLPQPITIKRQRLHMLPSPRKYQLTPLRFCGVIVCFCLGLRRVYSEGWKHHERWKHRHHETRFLLFKVCKCYYSRCLRSRNAHRSPRLV
jgi:hypothetical protein